MRKHWWRKIRIRGNAYSWRSQIIFGALGIGFATIALIAAVRGDWFELCITIVWVLFATVFITSGLNARLDEKTTKHEPAE